MLKNEAYKILDLPETSSKEEVKKAFKKLAIKYHPDVNKDPTAEQTFKSINEAYQSIENNTFDDQAPSMNWGHGNIDLNTIFNSFGNMWGGRSQTHRKYKTNMSLPHDISLEQTISFKESVLGCKKDITYNCNIECAKCHGEGDKIIDNGCKKCHGKGQVTSRQGHMIITTTCSECKGKIDYEECKECTGTGYIASTRTISVVIRPGIIDKTTLQLMGVGHFHFVNGGNTNVLLLVKVIPIEGLTLQDRNVISQVNISLLEALTGCSKDVVTIDGSQNITIPAASKNKEEVIIPKLGVERLGSQRVIINVTYPAQLDKLIDILKTEA